MTQKLVDGVLLDLTPEEEAERGQEYAAYQAAAGDRAMTALRAERNARLTACDWTQVADAPVDQLAWAAYRQQLRDYPETVSDPLSPPPWPVSP